MKDKRWFKVKVPQPWRPEEGQELIGTFIGTEIKEGQFGQYKVHFIRIRGSKIQFVSGSALDNLFAVLELDTKVKIKYNGKKPCSSDTSRHYKDFEVFTEEEVSLRVAQ